MEKENSKIKAVKETKELPYKESIKLAKKLIKKTRSILHSSNDFSTTDGYDINFKVDNIEYRAVSSQSENSSDIYFHQIVGVKKGFSVQIDEVFDKGGPSRGFPNIKICYIDENQNKFYNTRETVDKINEFLENFALKAN